MPVRFYLDKRLNKHCEAPIRVVWSFNGGRYQTTIGISVPPKAWDKADGRVSVLEHNHKLTPSTLINGFLDNMEKAVNRVENHAIAQNATLTKTLVKLVVDDVLAAGGKYPFDKEAFWTRILNERRQTTTRYFQHFKGGRYSLIGFGKNSETLEDVVIYQALYGDNQIWVRPYEIFFSKVKDENGNEVERFKEITIK